MALMDVQGRDAAPLAKATIRAIGEGDRDRVGAFLHHNLNSKLSPRDWADAMAPTWSSSAPNLGFMLLANGEVVGAQLAFYSERQIEGRRENICNMAALCVREDFRAHSLMLIRSALSQRGYSFTDFSPSGNVRPLNRRLGFQDLDTAAALVVNMPSLPDGTRVITDPEGIAQALTGEQAAIYNDHRSARAANHVVLRRGETVCYVIFRRDSRKRLPLFATILHVSDKDAFRRLGRHFHSHLLTRRGIPLTLAELRVVGHRPGFSKTLSANRVKMFSSKSLGPGDIDYLYSELTCVPW